MKTLVAVGIALFSGIAISQAVDESTSVGHPYTSLTPGALRADPERTKALLDAATNTYEARKASFDMGTTPSIDLYPASKLWMEIEVNLAKSKGEARTALANHASRMNALRKKIELFNQQGVVGHGSVENLMFARYAAIEAEILLLNAGGKVAESDAKDQISK